MKDDSTDDLSKLENKLTYIFSNVNEWLKFAEVKNAGLIAFLIAAVSGLLGFIASFQQLNQSLKVGMIFCVILLVTSCLISLSSFLPKVNRIEITFLHRIGEILEGDNLLFFGDLAKYDAETLLSKIAKDYFSINLTKFSKIHTDIAEQIIINSKITNAKFQIFKIALRFVFVAFISLVLVSLLHLIFLS